MRTSRTILAAGLMLAAGAMHAGAQQARAGGLLDVLVEIGRQAGGVRVETHPAPVPPPRPAVRVLELRNGQALAGLAGLAGSRQYFRIDVPAGAGELTLRLAGRAGDADLYLSREALPEPKDYQFRSNAGGPNEAIAVADPAPGLWYALVYGYTAFDGVSLAMAWRPAARPVPIPIPPPRPRAWLRITSPAAGAALAAGQTYWVTWAASGHTRTVRLLQSFDGGRTWTDIAPAGAVAAATGRAAWTVPHVLGAGPVVAGTLQIVDAGNPAVFDTIDRLAIAQDRGPRPGRPGHDGRGERDRDRDRRDRRDAYEPDNESSRASHVAANSAQIHTLDRKGDEDWVMFTPPAPGLYRLNITGATTKLKVRLYSASVGSTRESKSRTFTVGRDGCAMDLPAAPTVRYYKLQIEADDDDDTGAYAVSVQAVAPPVLPRPPVRPRR